MRQRTIVPLLRIFALLLPFLAALPAAAQEVTLTGWFNLVWEDPLKGPAGDRQRFFLTDDRGRTFELSLDAADLRSAGGALALDRRRVSVTARETALRGEGTPVLDVVSIRAPEAALRAEGAAPPQSGSKPYVTILCRFSDSTTVIPKSTYDAWMGSSYPGLDHYWRELSENQVNAAGSTVVGWFTLPQPYSFYVTNANVDLQKALTDCIAAADPTVNFTQFAGINMQFNTRFEYSWGGSRTLTLDGQTRTYGTTWLANWAGQSVYAHEMGHAFGLPHSSGPYTAVYDSRWDVMSNSYVFHDGAHSSYVGQHTIAYHKDLLGWIPAARKYVAAPGTTQTITLERSALPGGSGYLMAQVPIPGTSGGYYTVEARRNGVGYDRGLPGDAVVLHAMTTGMARVVDPDGNGNPNDAGAMWTPGETFTDPAAGISVAVVSASATGYQVTISTGATATPLAITSAAERPGGRVGVAYSDQLQATGGTGGYTWSRTGGTFPQGVGFTTAGALFGTPAAPGTYSYEATVSSGGASLSRTFTFTVAPSQFTITSDTLRPPATLGRPYADTLRVTGGAGPFTWVSGSGLPPGVVLTPAGALSGTPSHEGAFVFTATASSGGASVSRRFTLVVYAPVAVSSDSVRSAGVIGAAYSDRLQATGGDGSYAWAVTEGALPPGVTLGASGALAGTPTETGTFRFTASAASATTVASGRFVLAVHRPVSIVSDTLRRAGVMGRAYADTLVAQGGAGAASWRLASGALPAGVALEPSGALGGVPAEAGTFRFAAAATTGTLTAERAFTLTVTRPTLQPGAVIDQLLGTGALTADEARYLDLQGNRNGRVDLGDVRAWMQATGTVLPVQIPGLEDAVPPRPGIDDHTQEMER